MGSGDFLLDKPLGCGKGFAVRTDGAAPLLGGPMGLWSMH